MMVFWFNQLRLSQAQWILMSLLCTTNIFCIGQLYPAWPTPPKWSDKSLMARYLVHYAQWGVVSAMTPMAGLYVPYGTLQSFADGVPRNSTGTPYFYISKLSDTYKNIRYNNTVTLTISMAESDICMDEQIDPEEPPCARVTLLGQMVPIIDSTETEFAKMSLFERHPGMKDWPDAHGWNFYKLNLKGVFLLDMYGPLSVVDVKEYFQRDPVNYK